VAPPRGCVQPATQTDTLLLDAQMHWAASPQLFSELAAI
jgi:hypothetical protein